MAKVRLDKLVSESAGVTRSTARGLILRGEVKICGEVCRKIDTKVDTDISINVSGEDKSHSEFVYIMLNKPKGILSATEDKNDTTVVDLVKEDYPRRKLFPAGRLDKDSTGFVLLTDDGVLSHEMLSPKHHIPKKYIVTLDTPITEEMIEGFTKGVTLADGSVMKEAKLTRLETDNMCEVILTQGVYHQIKRMFGVFDAGVNELHRKSMGNVILDEKLELGEYRELTQEEVDGLV